MLKRWLVTLLGLLCIVLASAAMAATIGERVEIAQRRIEQGVRSGALTHNEANRLRGELSHVARAEDRARADGHLDRRERERLNDQLDRLERRISHLKHNDVSRDDGWRDHRRY
jgi:polyhydroxyalkanoate synthesis regulator phasin